MKKTKLISLALVAIMMLAMIPAGIFSASAATTIPEMPTNYPEGNISLAPILADFSSKTDGKLTVAQNSNQWTGGVVNPNPTGAEGIMFYLESSDTSKDVQFWLQFNGLGKRNGKDVRFTTSIFGKNNAYREGAVCTFYTHGANGWVKHEQTKDSTSTFIGAEGNAWYFIPFSSFFFTDLDGGLINSSNDVAFGMSYEEMLDRYNASIANISNLKVRQPDGTGMTLYLHNLYLVYPEYEIASENAATSSFFANPNAININAENGVNAVASNGVITITGGTNDTDSVSNQRAWIRELKSGTNMPTNRSMADADGIRFYVDSSSLGATQLLLRMRLKSVYEPDSYGDYTVITTSVTETTNFVALEATDTSKNNYTTVQYAFRSAGSVAYVYGENGEIIPCYGNEANMKKRSTHADTIALPAGYKGYVYIPMGSFMAHLGGSWGGYPVISWDKAAELGVADAIDQIAIIQTYSDNTDTSNYSVSYSDFQIVYEDVEVTQTSVSLGNDLSLNVKAETLNGATVESATYTMDGETFNATVKAIDGGYAIVCDGILPQDAGKTVTVTLNGKVGDIAVTKTVETSVKDYCLKLIATEGAFAEAKNAAADLLRYAGAAESFATSSASTILDAATVTVIEALGQKTNFEELDLTAASVKTESTAEGYDMAGAAIRLENALALKLFVVTPADSTATVKASFKLGDAEAVEAGVKNGVAVFGGIGACDLDTAMVITLTVDGEVAQTLSYAVTDYFANAFANSELSSVEADLVKALYDYGVSASAYADSLQ